LATTENRIKQLERENYLLQQQLQEATNRFEEKIFELSTVREIGLSLFYVNDFKRTCQTILNIITKNTLAQNCSIMLIDKERRQLFLVAASDPARVHVLETRRCSRAKGSAGCHVGQERLVRRFDRTTGALEAPSAPLTSSAIRGPRSRSAASCPCR
jgi:nitrate/nitrite-specific signal transduction histidine kinase